MPNESKLCATCANSGLTYDDFDSPPFAADDKYHKVVLSGTIGELRTKETQCDLCRLVLIALSRNVAQEPEVLGRWDCEWEAEWLQNACEHDPVDDADDMYGSALYPRLKNKTFPTNYGVQLVTPPGESRVLRARPVTSSLNIELIQTWINKCQNNHGDSCVDTYFSIAKHPSSVPGFLVIDVTTKSLKPLPDGQDYVALSYVWGNTNYPNLSKASLAVFQEDGAFEHIRLAKTIRDAIDLSEQLGFRFLWVDAICIVQDDDDVKDELINIMDAIYGNATLSIVAASGTHADAGLLLGGQGHRADRAVVAEQVFPGLNLGVFPHLDSELMESKYAQRGWTYQEACLSPRCLIIWDNLAYFVCRTAVWREDINLETNLVKPFDGANTMGKTSSEWPLRRFADHVRAYTSRSLTYQNDALRAFTGIQKALSTSMGNTEMVFGLPVVALDWALLWDGVPQASLTRRKGFPSWSWAGWRGTINLPMNHFSEFDQKWLRERTWIQWHLGELVDVVKLGSVEGHFEGRWNFVLLQDEDNSDDVAPTTDSDLDDASDLSIETFMPRYGSALTASRSYVMRPEFMSVKPPEPPSISCWHGTVDAYKHAAPLHFHSGLATMLIRLDEHDSNEVVDPVLNESAITRSFAIIDRNSRVCGVGCGQGPWVYSAESQCLIASVILMSWATPGSVSTYISDRNSLKLDQKYLRTNQDKSKDGEDVLGEWHEWDFLNILLVAELRSPRSDSHPGFPCERRGVGVIHRAFLDEHTFSNSSIMLF